MKSITVSIMQLPTVVQDPGIAERVDQNVIPDVKYQEITYYMCNNGRSVENEPVDLFKALSEMKSLNWDRDDDFIGFENHKTRYNI